MEDYLLKPMRVRGRYDGKRLWFEVDQASLNAEESDWLRTHPARFGRLLRAWSDLRGRIPISVYDTQRRRCGAYTFDPLTGQGRFEPAPRRALPCQSADLTPVICRWG